ncbi:MAG: hypothetical protein AAF802_11485 [Planctomycetota bacterium]
MQALPIPTERGRTASALYAPDYVDVETLRQSASLHAVAFGDSKRGVAVGQHGCILTSGDSGASWEIVSVSVHCPLLGVAWADEKTVMVVGGGIDLATGISRGVVLLSRDAGVSWGRLAEHELPRLKHVQFIDGRWLASGDPDPATGHSYFESGDGGSQWQSVAETRIAAEPARYRRWVNDSVESLLRRTEALGTPWMVRDVCKVGERSLVAVGDLGNIFQSTDQGKTWSASRQEKRSAILCLTGDVDEIPWGMLGRESLENRWQTQILVCGKSKQPPPTLPQAVGYAGARSVDHAVDGDESVPEQLRRWIAIIRPPVIAIDESMSAAMRAELTQFSIEQGTRVVIGFERQHRGDALLHDGAILTECGALVGDIEFDCRFAVDAGSVFRDHDSSASWLGLSLVHGPGNDSVRGRSLATRLGLSDEFKLPPRVRQSSSRRVQVLRARLKQQSQITEAIEHPPSTLGQWIDRIAVEDRQRLTWMMLSRAEHREAIAKLARLTHERFPRQSASPLLKLRSACIEQSVEHDWLIQGQPTIRTTAQFGRANAGMPIDQVSFLADTTESQILVPNASGHAAVVSPFQRTHAPPPTSAVPTAESTRQRSAKPSESSSGIDLRWEMHPVRLIMEHSLSQANWNESNQGSDEPQVQDVEIAVSEDVEEEVESEPDANNARVRDVLLDANLRRVAESTSPWAMLLKSTSPQVVRAARAEHPPRLDGKFDEPMWMRSDAFARTRTQDPIQVSFAYDDRFFYIATRQNMAALSPRPSGKVTGKRDSDLTEDDRLAIGFDIDRDLVSHYELQWTADGRTRDLID